MRALLVSCVLGLQLLWACSRVGGESPSVVQAQSAPAATTPAQKLIAAYLTVQRRLAGDDAKGARSAFMQLRVAAETKELGGDPALREKLAASAGSGASAKDLEAARDAFAKSSDVLLEWLKREGNALGTSIRVAHCPMARDGKGARWVQTEARVSNPYYGSEMLQCGSIEKELKPGGKL